MISECHETQQPIEIKYYQYGNNVCRSFKDTSTYIYKKQQQNDVKLLYTNLGFETQKIQIAFDFDFPQNKQLITLKLNNYSFPCTRIESNEIIFDLCDHVYDPFRSATSSTSGLKLDRIDRIYLGISDQIKINQISAPVRYYQDETNFVERVCYFQGFFIMDVYQPVEIITFSGTSPFGIKLFINEKQYFQGESKGINNLLKIKFNMDVVENVVHSSFFITTTLLHSANLQQRFFNATNNNIYFLITDIADISDHSKFRDPNFSNTIKVECDCLQISNINYSH